MRRDLLRSLSDEALSCQLIIDALNPVKGRTLPKLLVP